jgi:hypothetical protein
VAGVSDRAGAIYDEITDHGRNPVPEQRAMKEAFERELAEREKK